MAAALTVASLFAFAAPASAHTWNEVSRKTTCQYYSWGQLCNTRVTYFRHHSGFCNEGPGFGWPGKVAWYSYCYATTGY